MNNSKNSGTSVPVNMLTKAINRVKSYYIPGRILFIIMGIISSVWFLVRVIPKPSRAGYPCMRVAAPLMSSFILYIISLAGIGMGFRKAVFFYKRKLYLYSASLLLIAVSGILILGYKSSPDVLASAVQVTNDKKGPDDGPNQPFGKPAGIFPGRVVWIWNPDATNENCISTVKSKDWFWKPENIDEKVVGNMFRESITMLTGERKISNAWDKLFTFHNQRKKDLSRGYSRGERIFIKINQGTSRWLLTQEEKDKGYYFPEDLADDNSTRATSFGSTETHPYLVLEILRELVNEAGVAQSDIIVGDPMTDTWGHNYDIWVKEFPDVKYTDKFSTKFGRTMIKPTSEDLLFYSDKSQPDKLYDLMVQSDYMINLANLKPHLSAGISLTAKNHFGSQASPTAQHLHNSLIVPRGSQPTNGGYGKYRVLVDLMGSKYLGRNTVLFVVDGLFGGGSSETHGPVKYFMPPFNNDWCNSLFISLDDVAIQSVCYDFLKTEWDGVRKHGESNNRHEWNPNWNGVDDFLHQAADPSKWAKGITYDPDNNGKPLPSLGVHEHWNNPVDKQYSVNLGSAQGIELVSLPGTLVKNN